MTPSNLPSRLATTSAFLAVLALAPGCDTADTGPQSGGKADSFFDCEDDTAGYLAWLDSYKQSEAFGAAIGGEDRLAELEALAADKPCAVTDEAYLPWLAMFDQVWAEANPEGELVLAPDQRVRLEAVVVAAAEGSGARGYAAWLPHYQSALERALLVVLDEANTMILEETNVINADEEQVLDALLRAGPRARAKGAYETWIEMYAAFLDRATDPVGPEGPALVDGERAYLDRVTGFVPGVEADTAYLRWFQLYLERFDRATGDTGTDGPAISADEAAPLDRLRVVRPSAVGERPYLAWLGELGETLSAVVNSSGSTGEVGMSHLQALISVKPCGDSDEIQAGWARIEDAMTRVAAEVASLLEGARPQACQ